MSHSTSPSLFGQPDTAGKLPISLVKVGPIVVVDPTPRDVAATLQHSLRYTYTPTLGGQARQQAAADGRPQKEFLDRVFWSADRQGRLMFPRGLKERAEGLIRGLGYPCVDSVQSLPRQYASHPQWDVPHWKLVEERFQFRDGNRKALQVLCDFEYGRLSCTTGYGKTWLMGAASILFKYARILVVAKASQLQTTIFPRLVEIVPSCGIRTSGQRENLNARVLCCSADSLHHVPGGWPDIVFVDEADEAVVESYAKALMEYHSAKLFGFSGSFALRNDGLDMREEVIFGPVRFSVDVKEALAKEMVLPVEIIWRQVRGALLSPALGMQNQVSFERKEVWSNAARNRTIARDVVTIPATEPILVTCKNVEHIFRVRQYVNAALAAVGRPPCQMVFNPAALDHRDPSRTKAKTTRERLVKAKVLPEGWNDYRKQEKQKALADVLSGVPGVYLAMPSGLGRGADIPRLIYVIRADAESSKQRDAQISGRPCRPCPWYPKKVRGYVIDYLDEYNATLARRASTRRSNYKAAGRFNRLPEKPRR